MRIISAITNGNPAIVTTTFDHGYAVGIIGRLDIPAYIGMPQADQQVVTILTILGPTTFTINLNTTSFQPFVVPDPISAQANMTAMFVPMGEVNSKLSSATQNILPY